MAEQLLNELSKNEQTHTNNETNLNFGNEISNEHKTFWPTSASKM